MMRENPWLGFFQTHKLPLFERGEIDTRHPKRKRALKRRMTIERAMTQANDAGLSVASATINTDGSVTLTFGKPMTQVTERTSEYLRSIL